MKLNITRKEVLKAIRTEPLKGGAWFHEEVDDYGNVTPVKGLKNNVKCPVCAVGSILDCALGKKEDVSALDDFAGSIVSTSTVYGYIEDHNSGLDYELDRKIPLSIERNIEKVMALATKVAKEGKPLSALSMLFESLYRRKGFKRKNKLANAKLRGILAKFVKKNFPKRIRADENSSL